MNMRSSILLLQTSILAILFTLAMVAGYTLSLHDTSGGATAGAMEVSGQATTPPSPGKMVWRKNLCAACHNKNMKDNATGPALGGVEARWAAYPREDLYDWIRNSQLLVSKGHPRAKEVSEKYPGVMSNFPDLSDGEIEDLLSYINEEYEGRP